MTTTAARVRARIRTETAFQGGSRKHSLSDFTLSSSSGDGHLPNTSAGLKEMLLDEASHSSLQKTSAVSSP